MEHDDELVQVQQTGGGTTLQRKIVFDHTLSSVLHDPQTKRVPWNPPPIQPSATAPLMGPQMFAAYLEKIREPYKLLSGVRSELQLNRPEDSITSQEDGVKLNEIPQMYFRESLNLSDPATFKSALTSDDSFELLSEKLSHYLDIVEMEITNKISRRSTEFFSALRGLQTLHQEVLDACHEIDVLRDGMKTIDERIVKESLAVVQRRQRKDRYNQVLDKVATMKILATSQEAVKVLIESGDYFGALEIVKSTTQTIEEELPNIHCLRNLSSYLKEATADIEQKMSMQFVEFSRGEQSLKEDDKDQMVPLVRQLVSIGSFQRTLQLLREDQQESLKLMMASVMQPGVASLDKFDEASVKQLEAKEFVARLKNAFRRCLLIVTRLKGINLMVSDIISRIDEAERPMMVDIERQLSSMGISLEATSETGSKISNAKSTQASGILQENYTDMMKDSADSAEELISSQLTEEELLSVLNPNRKPSSGEKKEVASPLQPDSQGGPDQRQAREKLRAQGRELVESQRRRKFVLQECSDILFSVAELSHVRAARLLKVRTDLHRRLPLEHFHLLYQEVTQFIRDSESTLGRQCYGLRPTILAQSRAFLENFHTNRVNTLRLTLENDNWEKMEVPREFIFIFRCLVDPMEDLHVEKRSAEVDKSVPDNMRELDVLGEKYPGVNSLLMFGKILHDYLICLDTLPVLNQDLITRMSEILQLFNRRTAELVLLREATKTAGIKTVTASHLAMAAQCLSLLISLIPNLSERFRKYLKPEQFARLDDLDRVLQDYVEHRQQIFQEFVTMMGKRVDDCTKAYQQEIEQISIASFITSSNKPSKAFETLVKKTQMLHKILRPIMPGSQFRSVFRIVFKEYEEKLRQYFSKLPSGQREKQRMMNDVIFLLTKLRELEGVDDPGDDLLVFVQSRK